MFTLHYLLKKKIYNEKSTPPNHHGHIPEKMMPQEKPQVDLLGGVPQEGIVTTGDDNSLCP